MVTHQITMGIKTEGLERAGVIFSEIAQCIDFNKKFQLIIDHDPESFNAVVQYSELSKE